MKKKNKLFDVCNVYIFLWMFGFVQDLFLTSSLVSMLFYIPFLLLTVYNIGQVLFSFQLKGPMKVLSVFFVVLLCYGIVLLMLNNVMGFDRKFFLMSIFSSIGPVFSFYLYTKKGLLYENKLKAWFWPFLIIAIIAFFVSREKGIALAIEQGSDMEDVTNNASYFIAGLLPFIFLLKKNRFLQYLTIIVIFYFIITSIKRGAILVGALIFVWFFNVSYTSSSKSKRWAVLLLTIILLIVSYHFVTKLYEQNDYFQHRVEQTVEGNSSNRNLMYVGLLEHFITNDNPMQFLFGEGAYHTVNINRGFKAHNDWLELLIDCGLVTTMIYVIYWISFFVVITKNKSNAMIYFMLGASFIYTLTRTFFSMSFDDTPFFVSMIIGYCFANARINVSQDYYKLNC